MQKATFIIHGKLRRPEKLQKEIRATFSDIVEVSFLSTLADDGAKKVTTKAVEEGSDIIVVCGGDGSINEMVNGYFNAQTTKNVAFGVLPLGTGNDFAKSLKVSGSLEELKELVLENTVKEVDVFNMNYVGKNQESSSRYFINISDIGIGGFVAENVGKSSKLMGANLTYVKAIVSSFVKYKKQVVTLTSNEFNWEGQVLSLCMANGKYFGSGMCIAPDAKIDDGKLQLTILGDVSLMDYVKNLSKIKKGIKIIHDEVTYAEVSHCKIESKGEACPIDMDGEFVGYTPIEVALHSRKMTFFSPEN